MMLWNNDVEIKFFKEALENFASPEKLFYNLKDGYYAYVPKGVDAEAQTLPFAQQIIISSNPKI